MTDSHATTTTTPKATSASASDDGTTKSPVMDASCRSCVQLVREILQNPNSRPRQVLEAFAGGMQQQQQESKDEQPSFTLKPIDEGVQVDMRVPDEPWTLLRRWNRIVPYEGAAAADQQQERPVGIALPGAGAPVLATSSSLAVAPEVPSNNNSGTTKYTTETIRIECRPCDTTGPEQGARALIMGPNPLSIIACTNRLAVRDRDEMSEVLTHELVHAYDVRRLRLDFSDCESAAYSEVRAAREAECYSPSGGSGAASWAPTLLKEFCVKQRAIAATNNIFPSPKGRNCVRSVFHMAYKDPRPFSKADLQQYIQHQRSSRNDNGNNPHHHDNNNNRKYFSAMPGSEK